MQRSDFLNSVYAVAAAGSWVGAQGGGFQTVAGLSVPDSPLAREATAIASSSEPPEILNHSLRTFYFAELISKANHLDHDVEAVYVASILHDTGLTLAHMSEKERFEVDGANVSRTLAARHGVSEGRMELIWDAISLHDAGGIARWKRPEVMLVNAGVSADFGAYLDLLDRRDVVAVLEAAPRYNFVPVFLEAVAVVAKRKPLATGNCFVTDVGYRMVPGFHLSNFCDDVQRDPFDGYV
jgi:hypothetical protein